MTMLSQAAQLNYRGSVYLAKGAYRPAFESLSQAASILQSRNNAIKQGSTVFGPQPCSVSSALAMGMPNLSETRDFFIFSRTIVFNIQNEGCNGQGFQSPLAPHQELFCIAATLFNMGLGYHSLAKQTGKDFHLQKAFNMYSMCLEAVRQFPNSDDSECLNFVVVAALNNMAQLQYELGNLCHSQALLAAIEPLALSLSEATASACQVEECYMNVQIINSTKAARCA